MENLEKAKIFRHEDGGQIVQLPEGIRLPGTFGCAGSDTVCSSNRSKQPSM